MSSSKLSFDSPKFRPETEESNPEEDNYTKKSTKRLSPEQICHSRCHSKDFTFRKLIKHNFFAEDQSHRQKDQNQGHYTPVKRQILSKIGQTPSKRTLNMKQCQQQQYSNQMVQLLENCKSSIYALQDQLVHKKEQIKKLQESNQTLSTKLLLTQKQLQRTNSILTIYMKQAQSKTNTYTQSIPNNLSSENQYQIQITQLHCQIAHLNKIIQDYLRENQTLNQQKNHLQNHLSHITYQNQLLNTKIHKMARGVGKALSTIKKNNLSNQKINKVIVQPESERKNLTKNRQYGKIVFHPIQKLTNTISFETPLKTSLSTIGSTEKYSVKTFWQNSQQKLLDISLKAKRIDQFQKLQNILNRMQQLAQQEQQHDTFNAGH